MHALQDLLERGCLDNAAPTIDSYQARAGHLVRLLGERPLAELHLDDVQEFISQRLTEGAARETVRKELCVLRRAADLAHRRGIEVRTVAQLMPRFKVRYVPRKTWLAQAELGQLLAQLEGHRALFVLTAVYLGPRLSELEGLTWQDIRWEERLVHIRGTKGSPAADRWVEIHPRLLAALQATRRARGPILASWPSVRRDLARACERAGVCKVTPNDLRRTFASWLVQAGESSYVVSQLLGHSSSTMVERVYGRLSRQALASAISKLPSV